MPSCLLNGKVPAGVGKYTQAESLCAWRIHKAIDCQTRLWGVKHLPYMLVLLIVNHRTPADWLVVKNRCHIWMERWKFDQTMDILLKQISELPEGASGYSIFKTGISDRKMTDSTDRKSNLTQREHQCKLFKFIVGPCYALETSMIITVTICSLW